MIVDAISECAVPLLDAERRREVARARKSDSIRATHSAAYHEAISEAADLDDSPPRDPAGADGTAPAPEVATGVEYGASASPRQVSRLVSTRVAAEDAYSSN